VSQPYCRGAKVPVPTKLDPSLKEWWSENPWEIVREGHNLSCFERNRVYINVRGHNGERNFVDVSHLTGADSDGDGRCVVAGDFRNNGQQDVVVRQSGGGALLLFENHFPRRHYLKVSLRGCPDKAVGPDGKGSNRLGIGSRLVAIVNGQQIVREMYPLNSFRSQMPNIVHLGLGDAERVEKLTIKWPSGLEQVLKDLPGERHIVVEEGSDVVETVTPGKTIRP
jgi:hypothetical protein